MEGRFEFEALKPQAVKGLSEPVLAYQAIGIRRTSRFEAATARGLVSFVGRASELQLLLERWSQAKQGEGQVVMLSGDAGIGKSRILRELRDRLGDDPHILLRYQCSPYAVSTAFSPIVEQLQVSADFRQEDTDEEKLDKLERLLGRATDDLGTAAPLLAALLSLPGERYPSLDMTPLKQKVETVAALVTQLEGLSRQKPVLMLVEDVHWIDPSTLEAFDSVVERAQSLPVLVVMTYRPEFEQRWTAHGHVAHHSLTRLSRHDGRVPVLLGGRIRTGLPLHRTHSRDLRRASPRRHRGLHQPRSVVLFPALGGESLAVDHRLPGSCSGAGR